MMSGLTCPHLSLFCITAETGLNKVPGPMHQFVLTGITALQVCATPSGTETDRAFSKLIQ